MEDEKLRLESEKSGLQREKADLQTKLKQAIEHSVCWATLHVTLCCEYKIIS